MALKLQQTGAESQQHWHINVCPVPINPSVEPEYLTVYIDYEGTLPSPVISPYATGLIGHPLSRPISSPLVPRRPPSACSTECHPIGLNKHPPDAPLLAEQALSHDESTPSHILKTDLEEPSPRNTCEQISNTPGGEAPISWNTKKRSKPQDLSPYVFKPDRQTPQARGPANRDQPQKTKKRAPTPHPKKGIESANVSKGSSTVFNKSGALKSKQPGAAAWVKGGTAPKSNSTGPHRSNTPTVPGRPVWSCNFSGANTPKGAASLSSVPMLRKPSPAALPGRSESRPLVPSMSTAGPEAQALPLGLPAKPSRTESALPLLTSLSMRESLQSLSRRSSEGNRSSPAVIQYNLNYRPVYAISPTAGPLGMLFKETNK